MSHEFGPETRQTQTLERPRRSGLGEFGPTTEINLTSLIVSEGISNRLRPTQAVRFTTQEGQRVSFRATSADGKELVERVVTRIYRQQAPQAEWERLVEETKHLSSHFSPLRKELRAQFEAASALFSELIPQAACIAGVGDYFAANLNRFAREKENGRRALTANGKRFAEATHQWLGRLLPEASLEELKTIIDESLGNKDQAGLLIQSLKGKINWENKQRQYLVLEQRNPEELFRPQYYNELQAELRGAARFQYELSLTIRKAEQGLGREVDAGAEVQAFETILETESQALEAENERVIAEVAPEEPKDFLGKVKARWGRFINWFIKARGYKKVALVTVSVVSLAFLLTGSAGLPQQRLSGQESLRPDRPQADPVSTLEPRLNLSQPAVAAPQLRASTGEAVAQALPIQPPQSRPELKRLQGETERQGQWDLTKIFPTRSQENQAAAPLDEDQNQKVKNEAPVQNLQALAIGQVDQDKIVRPGLAHRQKQETEKSRGQGGPPSPMNPTPEPTVAQKELLAQTEPTLIIEGIPHNADLNSDSDIFEARGTWVDLDENGRLPDPPKDKVPLYKVGFLYGQTSEGKTELVASEGDVHAYIHNALAWAKAGWPKWKDWLSVAFDQGGIEVGDIIYLGGAEYKIIHKHEIDPGASLTDLFIPTAKSENLGRRLVISTCSSPPDGSLTDNHDLPRQVITAVLINEEQLAQRPSGTPTA